jgi:nitroimidazol reductase NimA-like FMN-containing flavoprotein (pyridoxamine 5'-phosphate oxidase superfamily)
MSAAETMSFLEEQPFGVLATIGPSGAPHQVTIGYAPSDVSRLYMTSFRAAQKVANIRRDSRASLLVEVTVPYREIRGALMTGAARVIDDLDQVTAWHRRLSERSSRLLPPDMLPPSDYEKIIPKRVLIELAVERLVTWDHRKLGGVY